MRLIFLAAYCFCRIPTVGGKALDLHRLFVEVTSRGGLEKVCHYVLLIAVSFVHSSTI